MGLLLQQCLMQRQSVSPEQRLQLKQLLQLKLELKHPNAEHAVPGFEGMQIADGILKERHSVGILIGGLSEAVWNQRRTEDELAAHKDVDVAVLDDDFELIQPFEGGIDWWLPKTARVRISKGFTSSEAQLRWYENGFGCVLSFGISNSSGLKPGLHIPDQEWVTTMREYEAMARVDENVNVEESVFEAFRKKIRKTMGEDVPRFVREGFKNRILHPKYKKPFTEPLLTQKSLEEIQAIHSHLGV